MVTSSSQAPERRLFCEYLGEALALLDRRSALASIGASSAGQLAFIQMDDERTALEFSLTGVKMVPSPERPEVQVAFGWSALRDLLEGREELASALEHGAIAIHAAPDRLPALFDSFEQFIHAAVRSVEMAALCGRVLDEARRRTDQGGAA